VIVVDASVLAPALADDGPDGDLARERLKREQLAAPELVLLEIISAIRGAYRAGRLDTRRCTQALTDLRALPLACAPHRPLVERVWELRDNASAYDAAYLALAELLSTTLLTADRRLEHVPGARCPVELIATAS
jgi:predicted nucleic acid-binding protein